MQKPKRRWYQFSLRTLFVLVGLVSILMAWVGYSLNWIRQRRALIETGIVQPATWRIEPATAPAGLWLFGESGVSHLWVRRTPDQSVEDISRLFPEAGIHRE